MSSLRPWKEMEKESCGVLGGGGRGLEGTGITTYGERLIAARRVTGDYFLIAAIKRERDRHASLPAFDVRVPRVARRMPS